VAPAARHGAASAWRRRYAQTGSDSRNPSAYRALARAETDHTAPTPTPHASQGWVGEFGFRGGMIVSCEMCAPSPHVPRHRIYMCLVTACASSLHTHVPRHRMCLVTAYICASSPHVPRRPSSKCGRHRKLARRAHSILVHEGVQRVLTTALRSNASAATSHAASTSHRRAARQRDRRCTRRRKRGEVLWHAGQDRHRTTRVRRAELLVAATHRRLQPPDVKAARPAGWCRRGGDGRRRARERCEAVASTTL